MAAREDVGVASEGVYWTPAHKDFDSRQNRWELLKNVMKPEGPRVFVFNTCREFIRTVPVLPRGETGMDDVDSAAEDHGDWDSDSGIREAGSAAAPYVAFPAEQENLGIMTEYLKAGFDGSRGGIGGQKRRETFSETRPHRST